MGWRRSPLSRPEAGRTRAWISPDLALIRFYRTPVKKPEAWRKIRRGGLGQMSRGARRRRAAAREETLGDTVFERMKSDDHEPAARLEQLLGGGKAMCQLIELVIEVK